MQLERNRQAIDVVIDAINKRVDLNAIAVNIIGRLSEPQLYEMYQYIDMIRKSKQRRLKNEQH